MAEAKPKAPKVRAPEEVWYDVHKHPEGVPGGMGRSPEHHLRGRGWSGHEINEGSGKKTIQYRNMKHPDFVISYGGGTSTKPDHNFRVLYMGVNTNVPKVTRAYSVAEAMNKVEELHQLHNGLVVQPMTHDAALVYDDEPDEDGLWHFRDSEYDPEFPSTNTDQPMFQFKKIRDQEHQWDAPAAYNPGDLCETCYLDRNRIVTPGDHVLASSEYHPFKSMQQDVRGRRFSTAQTPPFQQNQPGVVPATPKPAKPRDMTQADSFPKFPDRPQGVSEAWNDRHDKQLKEIPDPPPIKPDKPVVLKAAAGPARTQNDHGTLAGGNRHKAAGEALCPLCSKAGQVYRRDPVLYRDLIQDSGGLADEHLHTTSPFHDRVQEALIRRVGAPPRHPEGQGPADLGRAEYQRQHRTKQRSADDADVAQLAREYGMHIEPSEVARYRGLRRVVSAFQRAAQESWEEPKDYYHGTTEEDMDEVSPAVSHRRGVVFPHQTDPEYAYATPSERNAWHYAELAWNAGASGIPRVYRVRPTGPIEEDPTHWPNGESRGNFSDDVRSRHPFEVHEELPTPEYWLQDDDEDWEA